MTNTELRWKKINKAWSLLKQEVQNAFRGDTKIESLGNEVKKELDTSETEVLQPSSDYDKRVEQLWPKKKKQLMKISREDWKRV